MANLYKKIFVFCATFYVVCAKHEEYDGHSLYQVVAKNAEQTVFINGLENEIPIDVFAYANIGRAGQILVPKDQKMEFEAKLSSMDVEYSVLTENIREQLELEDRILAEVPSKPSKRFASEEPLPLNQIHRLQTVNDYLDRLSNVYGDRLTVETAAGDSVEGRKMKYLKISTTHFQDKRKPIIFLMSLLHAREWVTLPGTLYAIEKLVINVTDHDLINDYDWIIMPVANPDGYEFSHTNSRFWRKNRRNNRLSTCRGVDLNRNFDSFWGTASSNSPCAENYHGRGPFSEPETDNIRRILNAYTDRIDMFIDLHSFGSMILYGFGNGQLAPNALSLNLVGVTMAQAIDRVKWASHPNYVVGNIFHTLGYRASGGSSDYAQAGAGIPLSYAFELPAFQSSSGLNGFLVDPEFIRQAGFETWEGIKAGARFVRDSMKKRI